jgi:hypothetical protein
VHVLRLRIVQIVAAIVAATVACDRGPGPDACYEVCGQGTVCRDQRCVVADAVEEEPPAPQVQRSTGRRRKRANRDERTSAGQAPASSFRPIDDSHVPKYDPDRVQHIDMKSGTERLADSTIREHLRRLEPKFNACIETAALHSEDEIRPGRIDFVLSIEKTGKVSGVNVKAPKHLTVFGIVPCLRTTVFDHRFPSYDGPPTGVDYSFRVE